MKKILGATALSVVVASSLNAAGFQSGPYAGLNVGYASFNPKGKANDLSNGGTSGSVNKKKAGFQANALFGYEGMPSDGLILGGEFQVGKMFGTSKKTIVNPGNATDIRGYKVSQKWKTGLYGLVGTPLSDTVTLYGKLGILYSQFNLKVSNDPNDTGANSALYSNKTSLWGLEPGVRLSVALTDALSAQFDASYAWYKKSKSLNTLPGAALAATTYLKYQPRIWGVTAGVAYKF